MSPTWSSLAVIPARAHSEGLPGKHTRLLHGRTLLAHAADCARRSGVCDRIVLTTDGRAIAAEGDRLGLVVIRRPPSLAGPEVPLVPVLQHVLAAGAGLPDIVVLLQPTSPLRTPLHLQTAVALLRTDPRLDSVVSVTPVPATHHPDRLCVIEPAAGCLIPYRAHRRLDDTPRRQDAGTTYVRNGLVYAVRTKWILEGSLYGDACYPLLTHAADHCTIDTAEDWAVAEARLDALSPADVPVS